MKGTVKNFSDLKNYGFIEGDDGQDYFVHVSMIDADDGMRSLAKDQTVFFDPVETRKGWQAWNVHPAAHKKRRSTTASSAFELKVNPFTPQDPVTEPEKFAGRAAVLMNAIDCLFNNKNLLITGDRGIGKSSLSYQLVNLTRGDRVLIERIGLDTKGFEFRHLAGDHRCLPGNTLAAVAHGLLASVEARERAEKAGEKIIHRTEWDLKIFKTAKESIQSAMKVEELALDFSIATERLIDSHSEPTTGVCFLIDEVDLLEEEVQIAPFLKAVVEKLRLDGYSNVSFILSGVTGSVTSLISQHPSAVRLTENLNLDPMSDTELKTILETALSATDTEITNRAKESIINLANRFPAPVHLLGYHAFRLDQDRRIDRSDVAAARDFVVQNLKRQEFEGRLERLGGGVAAKILRVVAANDAGELPIEEIASRLGESRKRVAGTGGNLVRDGLVRRTSRGYKIAEPLFWIYLQWVFGID